MGLDMYLSRELYLGDDDDVQKIIVKKKTHKGETTKVFERPQGATLTQEVAYWRKTNMVHRYLTDPNNSGIFCVDGDMRTEFDVEVLRDLRHQCQKVLKVAGLKDDVIVNADKVADLLPTKSGYFFGSISYDKGYLEAVKYTVEQLDRVLAEHEQLLKEGFNEFQITYKYFASY